MTLTVEEFTVTQPELFAVLVDPATYPMWLVGAKNIREIANDWPREGSWFKHVVGFGPLAIPDRTTVLTVLPTRTLVLLVRVRPLLEARVSFEIEATPGGCRLRMTEEPLGVFRMLTPLAAPLIRARNERSLQRLHDVVEPRTAATVG